MSSFEKRGRGGSKFTASGVRDYERRRYRGIDQRIVHARETRLIRRALAVTGMDSADDRSKPVLDLPCGYGRFTHLFMEIGREVVGSDLSLEMVRRAGERLGRPGVVANATQGLPFKSGAFETVFSIRFFHHLHNPKDRAAVLAEFRRVTGAWAVVSFYRMSGLHRVQRGLRRLFHKSRTNIKMIEAGRFEREVEDAGFDVVREWPLFRGLHAYHLALLKKK